VSQPTELAQDGLVADRRLGVGLRHGQADAGRTPVNGSDEDARDGNAPVATPREDRSATGDDAVDEALTRLATLDGAPLAQHVAVFDAVHAALQDRLADTEG
jgi:hypothetical protein